MIAAIGLGVVMFKYLQGDFSKPSKAEVLEERRKVILSMKHIGDACDAAIAFNSKIYSFNASRWIWRKGLPYIQASDLKR